jgi:hypothetical protein
MKILYILLIPVIFVSGIKTGRQIENFKNQIDRKEESILLNKISLLEGEISILQESIAYCKADRKRLDENISKNENKGLIKRVFNI